VRRFVIFLGLFSLLCTALLVLSAVLVEIGVMRSAGHVWLAWAAAVPMLLYFLLSLRLIVKKEP